MFLFTKFQLFFPLLFASDSTHSICLPLQFASHAFPHTHFELPPYRCVCALSSIDAHAHGSYLYAYFGLCCCGSTSMLLSMYECMHVALCCSCTLFMPSHMTTLKRSSAVYQTVMKLTANLALSALWKCMVTNDCFSSYLHGIFCMDRSCVCCWAVYVLLAHLPHALHIILFSEALLELPTLVIKYTNRSNRLRQRRFPFSMAEQ